MEWQPIETAPKDRWILVTGMGREHPALVAKFVLTDKSGDRFRWGKVDNAHLTVNANELTHWMPLPAPPGAK